MIELLFSAFSQIPQVEAIALGGSRAGTDYDEKSDYDVYLYISEPIDEHIRRSILKEYCSYMEIGNHFWELEDNCTLKNGIDIDILYRNLDDFCAGVADVVEQYNAHNGYTTCMWHNLLTCKILYDRDGRLAAAIERFHVPYPEKLRQNIIDRNWQLLHTSMAAYEGQILKAAKREDMVSINHRVSGFLESYFDILFALNRQTHPGEKRIPLLCRKLCPVLPEQFEENLEALFQVMLTDPEQLPCVLDAIVTQLVKLL